MRPLLYRQITGLAAAKTLGSGVSVASAVAVAAAGTGYTVNDVLTAAGGTSLAALRLRVKQVNAAGGVVTFDFLHNGAYTAKPADPTATTGGTGAGATLTVTWRDNSIPVGTQLAVVIPEAQPVRYRDDGPAPQAAVGMLLAVGARLDLTGESVGLAQFIESASGATLNVSFYG